MRQAHWPSAPRISAIFHICIAAAWLTPALGYWLLALLAIYTADSAGYHF
jgi:hypothetical protein